YQATLEDIVSLAYNDRKDAAYDVSSNEGYKARNESIALLNKLVEKNKQSMIADKERSDLNYRSTVDLLFLVVVCSVMIAIALSYWIITSIAKRISNITAEAEKIASREYADSEIKSDINDELQP